MIKDSSMRKKIPKSNDRLWRENLFDLRERRGGASCTLIVPEEATLETSPDRVEGQNSQLLFRGVENPCPVPFIRAIFGSQVTNIHGLQQRLWKTSSRFPFFFFSIEYSMPNKRSKETEILQSIVFASQHGRFVSFRNFRSNVFRASKPFLAKSVQRWI